MQKREKGMQSIRVLVAFVAVTTPAVSPLAANATGSTQVVISEVMTAGTDSAGNEFIELYNPTDQSVEVAGWQVQYKSATSTDTSSSWSKKSTLSGVIAAYGFYLVAPKALYPDADSDWTATLASGGGNVRLINAAGTVIDQLGYGETANAAEDTPAAAPPAGQSLERLPGKLSLIGGNGSDTNNNSQDFLVSPAPQPQTTKSAIEIPGAVLSPDDPPVDQIIDEGQPEFLPLQISELLPNPASPLSDADDEFIEIFNPNSVAVNYGGYKLKGGSNFHTAYTLSDGWIQSGSYAVFTSDKTHIGLTNTGGAVQLLDPNDALVDQTPSYPEAPEGEAWAMIGNSWKWTLQATPGGANVIMTPLVTSTTKASATKTTTKPKATSAPAPKKVAAVTKAKAASKPKVKAKTTKAKKSGPVQLAAAQLKPVSWLIIVLAVLTIGYALYEFRHDLRNYYYKFRANRRHRGGDRSFPRGRGDD
jgi:hypothetical protein